MKNRLKNLYRSRGVQVAGRGVYTTSKRREYLDRLPKPARPLAELLYQELDALQALKSEAKKAMLAEAKRHPEFRLVRSCPGLGPIRAAELLPIVVTPYRFQNKRGFWSYCGLGVVMRSSSDWVRTQTGEWMKAEVKRTRGLNRNFNHTLRPRPEAGTDQHPGSYAAFAIQPRALGPARGSHLRGAPSPVSRLRR